MSPVHDQAAAPVAVAAVALAVTVPVPVAVLAAAAATAATAMLVKAHLFPVQHHLTKTEINLKQS